MHVMTRLAGVLAIAVIAGTAPAAQKPAASNDHRYDVTIAFDGDRTYTGAMTLTFDGSRVSGKMAIDTPAVVTGTVAGTVKAGALSLDYPYQVAGDSPCTGRVTVSAKLSADRSDDTRGGLRRSARWHVHAGETVGREAREAGETLRMESRWKSDEPGRRRRRRVLSTTSPVPCVSIRCFRRRSRRGPAARA